MTDSAETILILNSGDPSLEQLGVFSKSDVILYCKPF